jgi:hypothetical protein
LRTSGAIPFHGIISAKAAADEEKLEKISSFNVLGVDLPPWRKARADMSWMH